MRRRALWSPGLAAPALAGCSSTPLGYLSGAGGPTAAPTQHLAIGFTVIALAVILIIAAAIAVALTMSRRSSRTHGHVVARSGDGLQWIYWGLGLSFPALVAMAIWSFGVTRAVAQPTGPAAVTVDVTGHRWWWEVRYHADVPDRIVTTANELVIPTGVPIHLRLTSADVIHDFWVPKLGPKMDMIPGHWNATWLQADRPGTYVGQCAEYCGLEHAMMGLRVRALAPADYVRWRTAALQPATPDASRGSRVFAAACAGCHAVRGTPAGGILGPDLTHFASRDTIAAGVLPNTPANRNLWVAETQRIKPGVLMPTVPLTDYDRSAVVAYLGSLR